MTLFDRNDIELAKVRRSARRLYVVKLEICAPVCLEARRRRVAVACSPWPPSLRGDSTHGT
jgi:hypothetical protein